MSVFWMYKLKCVSREAYFNFTNYEKEKKRGGVHTVCLSQDVILRPSSDALHLFP